MLSGVLAWLLVSDSVSWKRGAALFGTRTYIWPGAIVLLSNAAQLTLSYKRLNYVPHRLL